MMKKPKKPLKPPKKPLKPRKYEAHIYMDEGAYEALKRAADRDVRSVAGQALFYIMRSLEAESRVVSSGNALVLQNSAYQVGPYPGVPL